MDCGVNNPQAGYKASPNQPWNFFGLPTMSESLLLFYTQLYIFKVFFVLNRKPTFWGFYVFLWFFVCFVEEEGLRAKFPQCQSRWDPRQIILVKM